MPLTKLEKVEGLARALLVRQAELKANEEVVRKATLRSESLRAAIADLRKTLAELIEEVPSKNASAAPSREDSPELPLECEEISADVLAPIEGTIIERVAAHLETAQRAYASEIAQTLGIRVEVVRTTLSKLHAKGRVRRLGGGEYCSLAFVHADDVAGAVRRSKDKR